MTDDLPRRSEPRAWKGRWRWPSGSLLASLDEQSLMHLLDPGVTTQYRAGDILSWEGDRDHHVSVLLDGVVKETGLTPWGKKVMLGIRVGGDLIGEFSALDDGPREADVTACGPTVVRVITQHDFLTALRQDESLALAVTRSISAKLRQATASRLTLGGYDSPARVARVIWEIASRYGHQSGSHVEISVPLTQAELASLSGVAEPTLQKVLRDLRTRGIISTGYRAITVTDIDALDAAAGGSWRRTSRTPGTSPENLDSPDE